MELLTRKQNRLKEYDYSTPNAYFITICTEKRKNLFWMDVGAIIVSSVTWYTPVQGHGTQLTTLQWICELADHLLYQTLQF